LASSELSKTLQKLSLKKKLPPKKKKRSFIFPNSNRKTQKKNHENPEPQLGETNHDLTKPQIKIQSFSNNVTSK
jgi:hypothetical protein